MMIPLDQLEAHPDSANAMAEPLLKSLCVHIESTGLYPPIIVRVMDEPRAQASGAVGRTYDDGPTESEPAPAEGSSVGQRPLTKRPHSLALGARMGTCTPAARYQILDGHQRAIAGSGCHRHAESSFRGAEHARGGRATTDARATATGRVAQSSDPAHGTRAERFQILDGHQRAIALSRLGRAVALCEVWNVDDDEAAMLLLTLNRLRGRDDPLKRGALAARLASARPVAALAKLLPETPAKLGKLIGLTTSPPKPRRPRAPGDMPHPVTFFLTSDERRDVLRALSAVDRDRKRALMKMVKKGPIDARLETA